MLGKFKNAYWVCMGWNFVLSLVAVPVGALYLNSLVSFTPLQLKALVIHLAWLPSLLFVFSALHHGWWLKPVIAVVDDISANRDVSDDRLKQAEFRALVFPYLNFAGGVFWFWLGGFVLSRIMLRQNGFSSEAAFFITACSATTGFVAGLLFHYSSKYPMAGALAKILARFKATSSRPRFFVPIMIKQVATFTIVLTLVLSFLGFYSFVTAEKTFQANHLNDQSEELINLGSIMAWAGDMEKVKSILQTMATADKALCLVNDKQDVLFCAGQYLDHESLDLVAAVNWSEIVLNEKTGWTYSWMATGDDSIHLISGWAPLDTSDIKNELRRKFSVVGIVIVVVGIILGILAASDVAGPIKQLSLTAVRISEGQTELSLPPGREDETGVMARAFMKMTGILLSRLKSELARSNGMMISIREAVETLAPMSQQLVVISGQQSTSSVKQASAAEEAAVTSGQVAAVSRQIAESSAQVSESAEQALTVTKVGHERLDHAKSTFDDISGKMADIASSVESLEQQSEVIEGIIAIIEEVSDQTSLLAFNAAIEAVGAGTHGKRFGIVAQEIQRLAQNTAESIDNIREIVSGMKNALKVSVAKTVEGENAVSSGKGAVGDMVAFFNAIFESASHSTDRLKEINLMTTQQASASEQMAQTLDEVRETARQSSDASLELKSSVSELEKIVLALKSHIEHDGDEITESTSSW